MNLYPSIAPEPLLQTCHLRPRDSGGGLEGRMILYVPKQEAAIPQKIIDYARRPGVLIVESR